MLTDAKLLFSSAQAITSTAASTNIVDLGVNNDPGIGDPTLQFAIYVGTTFTTGDAAALQVQVQGAPNSSGSPGSYVTIIETDVLAVSVLAAQAEIPLDLSKRSVVQALALYRFLRLNYVVSTGTFTAGTLTAMLVINRDSGLTMGQYPSGYTVGN